MYMPIPIHHCHIQQQNQGATADLQDCSAKPVLTGNNRTRSDCRPAGLLCKACASRAAAVNICLLACPSVLAVTSDEPLLLLLDSASTEGMGGVDALAEGPQDTSISMALACLLRHCRRAFAADSWLKPMHVSVCSVSGAGSTCRQIRFNVTLALGQLPSQVWIGAMPGSPCPRMRLPQRRQLTGNIWRR